MKVKLSEIIRYVPRVKRPHGVIKTKKPPGKIKKAIKTITKRALQLTLLVHLASQANYCYQSRQDTEQRIAFEQEFGFPVYGFKRDVEWEEGNLSKLADAVHREMLERPFDMEYIRISSDRYSNKSISGQLEFILAKGGSFYDGISLPYMERIFFARTFSYSIAHHEIKHVKTDDIMTDHPEFLDRWRTFATDDEGKSLYGGYVPWAISRVRLVGDLVDPYTFSLEENQKVGFISNYARLWIYEDIAKICEATEMRYYDEDFVGWLYVEKNPHFIGKVNLAQEYGLIPTEFSEYILVQKTIEDIEKSKEELTEKNRNLESEIESYEEILGDSEDLKERIEEVKEELKKEVEEAGHKVEKSIDDFFEASEEFLNKYPDSIYVISLRKQRGDKLKEKLKFKEAIEEYKKGLLVEYKYYEDYQEILVDLAVCHAGLANTEAVLVYVEAKRIYEREFNANNIEVVLHGVNDFLEEQGQL